jgi:hypothetical protein
LLIFTEDAGCILPDGTRAPLRKAIKGLVVLR